MQIKVQLLHPKAQLPTYGTKGAAAFDLYASEDVRLQNGRANVGTGLAFEIPPGYGMFIKSRSGLAFKNGIHAFHGTIDSDYREEVRVLLMAEHPEADGIIHAGERIAQAIIQKVESIQLFVVDDLSITERKGGFGSTGK